MLLYLVLLFVSPMRSVDNPCGTPVQSCPTTEQSWNRRASSFPCSKQHLHYVCIFYKDGQLMEACIINFPVASSAGGCPSVSSCDERGPVLSFYSDYTPCPVDSIGCPRTGHGGYNITQLYKFPFCVGENGSEIISSTTPSTFTPSSTPALNIAAIVVGTTSTSIVVFLVVFATIIWIVCYKRRKIKKISKGEEDVAETIPLDLAANDIDDSYGIPDDLKDFLGENSESSFYKTKAYSRITSIINDGKSVLLVGYLGSGKTHTCFRLFQEYHGKRLRGKIHKCQYVDKLDDLRRRRRFNKKEINILLLDDCFEHWNYIHQAETKDITLINNYYQERRKIYSASLVITINSFTWEIHKDQLEDLKDFTVLNISSGEYELTNAEKELICEEVFRANCAEIPETKEQENFRIVAKPKATVTLKVHRASIKTFAAEINSETPIIGFQVCCALFCRCKAFMLLGEKFFEKPLTALKEEIARLRDSGDVDDQIHYLTLVYVMLRGRIDVQSLDTYLLEKLGKVLLAQGVAVATYAVMNAVGSMLKMDRSGLVNTESPFLVNRRDELHVFMHETVHVAVLLDFGCIFTRLFLELCDRDILFKYVISSEGLSGIQTPEIKLIRVTLQRHQIKYIRKRFPKEVNEILKHHIAFSAEGMQNTTSNPNHINIHS